MKGRVKDISDKFWKHLNREARKSIEQLVTVAYEQGKADQRKEDIRRTMDFQQAQNRPAKTAPGDK